MIVRRAIVRLAITGLVLLCAGVLPAGRVISLAHAQDVALEAPPSSPSPAKPYKRKRAKKPAASPKERAYVPVSVGSAAKASVPTSAVPSIRIIPDADEIERQRDRELRLDKQHAEALMAMTLATAAAQSAASSVDRLLLPLWIFTIASISTLFFLVWNLSESRRAARSARESVKELVRLNRQARISS